MAAADDVDGAPALDRTAIGRAAEIDPTGTTLTGVVIAGVLGAIGAAVARALRRRRRA